MISVLLPTRKRPAELRCAVDSVYALATRPDQIEVILRVDEDDPTDYSAYRTTPRTVVLTGERWGYRGMHRYYNQTSDAATGKWLVLWNDDMEMMTNGWDEKIEAYGDRLCVLFLNRDGHVHDDAYPVWPKKLSDLLGHASQYFYCDTWLSRVSEMAGIKVMCAEVVLRHRRLSDETARDAEAGGLDNSEYGNPEMSALWDVDVARIRAFLAAQETK